MRFFLVSLLLLGITSCKSNRNEYAVIGNIEAISPSLGSILDTTAKIEIVAEGYDWTEGPLWLPDQKALLFSDIPPNKIFKWTEEKGAELYLTPSGYSGSVPRTGEPGSNGLLLSPTGKLVLCQHGDRRLAIMEPPLDRPAPEFETLIDQYQGKKLNSPNDAVYHPNGDLLFTDPPYGLEKNVDDPAKELAFQGVYLLKSSGELRLLTDSLTRPNGIALTNTGKSVIIANSDPEKARWYLFDLQNDSLINGRILLDATTQAKSESGLPDGLKTDKNGNIFATGPGGVWIFDAKGTLAGKIRIPSPCSNVALADDEKTLFITADSRILRLRLRK